MCVYDDQGVPSVRAESVSSQLLGSLTTLKTVHAYTYAQQHLQAHKLIPGHIDYEV